MGVFQSIAIVCGAISALAGVVALVVKIWKSANAKRKGDLAVLRAHMLSIYYANRDNKTIRQYELENFIEMYDAYTARGGNSFMKEIHETVVSWTVVT